MDIYIFGVFFRYVLCNVYFGRQYSCFEIKVEIEDKSHTRGKMH